MKALLHFPGDQAFNNRLQAVLHQNRIISELKPVGQGAEWSPSAIQSLRTYDFLLMGVGQRFAQGYAACCGVIRRIISSEIPIRIYVFTDGRSLEEAELIRAGAEYCIGDPTTDYNDHLSLLVALIARVQAAETEKEAARDFYRFGSLFLNANTFIVTDEARGASVQLTAAESTLLAHLMRQPSRLYGRAELMETIYQSAECPDDRIIDSRLKRIRKKLTTLHPEAPLVIKTVYGGGYQFDVKEALRFFPALERPQLSVVPSA